MKIQSLVAFRYLLRLFTFATLLGMMCLSASAETTADSALSLQVHPQVFNMIRCWISDTESPVVTEINLDAVETNRNQFSKEAVKNEDGWTVCRETNGKGFQRYRLIESKADHHRVEYQENGGGTLTTSSVIGFFLTKRVIYRNGKATSVKVLRVDSIDSN